MTYQEAIDFLYDLQRSGVKLGLKRVKKLLSLLGNPHKNLQVIHVGGTNGKGSVTTFISSILKEAGFRIGTYTSPHLTRFNERIAINGRQIKDEEITSLVEEIRPQVLKVGSTSFGHPTFFEVTTAMAFLYFQRMKPEFVVCEVGLGGRLDATNVLSSLIQVITNIGVDHIDYLGNSIPCIAKEKAGIIKNSGTVIVGIYDQKVLRIFERICSKRNATLFKIWRDMGWRLISSNRSGQIFSIKGIVNRYDNLHIKLLGNHQILNAVLSVGVVELLRKFGIVVKEEGIRLGLAKAQLPGRLEIIRKNPLIVLDVAHNEDGARALRNAIVSLFTYDRLILVIGILKDKAIDNILEILTPLASTVVVTQPMVNRATELDVLLRMALRYNRNTVGFKEVKDGVRFAQALATESTLILITGSHFTVSEARNFL
ncbi:MAG: folylpolyglutamate synthase/dihydrofolate synthase family protein [bacterium]|nr:folylpolyglutamate synthase/dihydrofolate synthase family protein [bacterium]